MSQTVAQPLIRRVRFLSVLCVMGTLIAGCATGDGVKSNAGEDAEPTAPASPETETPTNRASNTTSPDTSEGSVVLSPSDGSQKPPTNNVANPPTTQAEIDDYQKQSVESATPADELDTASTTTPSTTTTEPLQWSPPYWPVPGSFVEGAPPAWPFRGLVQLWPIGYFPTIYNEYALEWALRYWTLDPDETHRQVRLPGLRIDCLGQVGMISLGEDGIEVGGAPDVTNWTFRVRWGEYYDPVVVEPSDSLLESVQQRPSNIEVTTEGDLLRVDTGTYAQYYEMRDPLREYGDRWNAQARHNGEIFMLSVHPAHLPCFSGVTWLSLADTGELLTCGANSAATVFIDPEATLNKLVLPQPEDIGTYLACPTQLTPS